MPPQSEDHTFLPPGPSDLRSACPGLNALANHSILPHNGRDISFFNLTRALVETFNFTYPLATVLALLTIFKCGNPLRGTVTLEQLAVHGRLEHDISLFHDDTPEGEWLAPIHHSQELLDKCLARSSDGQYISLEDLMAHKTSLEHSSPDKFGRFSAFTKHSATLEGAVILEVFGGNEKKIPIGWLREFVEKEKLPEGWVRNEWKFGLAEAKKLMGRMDEVHQRLLKEDETREEES